MSKSAFVSICGLILSIVSLNFDGILVRSRFDLHFRPIHRQGPADLRQRAFFLVQTCLYLMCITYGRPNKRPIKLAGGQKP